MWFDGKYRITIILIKIGAFFIDRKVIKARIIHSVMAACVWGKAEGAEMRSECGGWAPMNDYKQSLLS